MTAVFKKLARAVVPERLWMTLREARIRRYLKKHYESRYIEHTYGGVPLKIHLADHMAEDWYGRDLPELNEIELLKKGRLRPGAKVFNLGAHQAVFALMMAKIVGPDGLVVAVEANWHNAAVAKKNRALNNISQLVIVEAAVAEESGTLFFSDDLNGHVEFKGEQWGRRPVPCISIDDLTSRYGVPDVLFVDVEGFEPKVLEGARQTLKHRPDCFVEVHVGCGLENYGFSPESVISFFGVPDYKLFVAGQDEELFSTEFHPYKAGSALPDQRFFLVALNMRQ